MTRKSLLKSPERKSAKYRPAYRYQPVKGEKTLEGKPILNPPPGRGFVELHGKRHYINAPYESGEGWGQYWDLIRQWENNGYKPFPTHVKTGISVNELAAKYLGWFSEQGYTKETIEHCHRAMQFLIDHCGSLSTADFTRHTLKSLQEKLVTDGVNGEPYKRLTINRYINLIKNAFIEGEERGWGIDENLPGQLAKVRALRQGRTTAGEYQERDGVDDAVVEKTLPFMSETVQAMTMVHRVSDMRSQDVCNLRICDIEMNDPDYPDVWFYAPHTHKTQKKGKKLLKAIPPEAQEILAPFIEAKKNDPTAYIFSPRDVLKKHRQKLRESRKTPVQPSQVERAKRAKKRKPKNAPGEKYQVSSYRTAVQRAQERARAAGVDIPEKNWFPHQLRHTSTTEIKDRFGMKAARDMAGHSNSKVTKGYTKTKKERIAKVARKQRRVFSDPNQRQNTLPPVSG